MLELVGQLQAAVRHRIANELRYQAGACARVAFREAAPVEDRERVFRTDDESLPGVVREGHEDEVVGAWPNSVGRRIAWSRDERSSRRFRTRRVGASSAPVHHQRDEGEGDHKGRGDEDAGHIN